MGANNPFCEGFYIFRNVGIFTHFLVANLNAKGFNNGKHSEESFRSSLMLDLLLNLLHILDLIDN